MANKGSGLKSPSAVAYRNLVKKKGQYCAGKVNQTAVKQQAANYKKTAIKAGKAASEVDKTIARVLKAGCSMSSSIAARKKTTTKKKTLSVVGTRKRTVRRRRAA